MNPQKKSRLSKAAFAVLMALIVWGIVGSIFWPITVTSYWGIGLGTVAALLFILSLFIEKFGIQKSAVAAISVLLVVLGAMVLNRYRGWPFGLVTYHDILGWKMLKDISWPMPLFWTFVGLTGLMFTQPKKATQDPKAMFSWAFDSAVVTLVVAVIVEPILTATAAESWSADGLFHGVPLSCFVGWFLTSFVASSIAILTSKLWQAAVAPKHQALLLVASGLSLLGLCAASRLALPIPQLFCLAAAVYLAILTYRMRKSIKQEVRSPAQSDDQAKQS